MKKYYAEIERDQDGKWGFGKPDHLGKILIIDSDFDFVYEKVLELLNEMKETLRGRDSYKEYFKNELESFEKAKAKNENDYYVLEDHGDHFSDYNTYYSKEEKEFWLNWQRGGSYLRVEIKQVEVITKKTN